MKLINGLKAKKFKNVIDIWLNQNNKELSQQCTNKTLKICFYLFEKFLLIPKRIAVSAEKGWYIIYSNHTKPQKTLSIEIYDDDLETIALINNDTQIICVEEVRNLEFDKLIEKFYQKS
jgi:hypothetical protein